MVTIVAYRQYILSNNIHSENILLISQEIRVLTIKIIKSCYII